MAAASSAPSRQTFPPHGCSAPSAGSSTGATPAGRYGPARSLTSCKGGAMNRTGRLRVRAVPTRTLDRATMDAMWRLYEAHYDHVDRATFDHDLAEKTLVFLGTDAASGEVVGFSTALIYRQRHAGRTVGVYFSGDTIVHPRYWGQTALHRSVIATLLRWKVRHPLTPAAAAVRPFPWPVSPGPRCDEASRAPGVGETRLAAVVGVSLWPVSRRARATGGRASQAAQGGPHGGGAHGVRQTVRHNRPRVVPGVPGARADRGL